MNPSTQAARLLLQALADLGVRHVVLSPGSRSAPLAHALAQAALPDGDRPPGAPALDLHVRIDERAAGFLALGLARAAVVRASADGTPPAPVAVVTTSGSAVANLHPAVVEAHHAALPLLLLTADRPHELRGSGANQTTEQPGMFARAVRMTFDISAPTGRPGESVHLRRIAAEAVAAASGTVSHDAGPVHLNLAYREPLVPDGDAWPPRPLPTRVPRPPEVRPFRAGGADARAADRPLRGWAEDRPTLVVAGDGAGPVAREVAEANGWPLLAEPSSGARGGPNAVGAYRLVLAAGAAPDGAPALADAVRRVVVMGRPTLSRPVLALLARRGLRSIAVVHQGSATPDAGRGATYVLSRVPDWLRAPLAPGGDPAWLARWRDAGAAAAGAVREVLAGTGVLTGPQVAAAVAAAVASGPSVLVAGASNPLRDLDLVADWDTAPLVLSNRGLSGIDGTLSTATGVALGLGRPVTAYVGDLTFLHDAGGLLVGPLERRPDLRVVVANDGGGSVFATLEHGETAHARGFERVFGTPHGADLGALCAGYGVGHVRVADAATLAEALAEPVAGTRVVEVAVDRAGRRELHVRLAEAAAAAVRTAGQASG